MTSTDVTAPQSASDTQPTGTALATAVRTALGLRAPQAPLLPGETPTRVSVWSQFELSGVFERVGGTVTSRQVERADSSGDTWTATEITVTTDLPGIGRVEVVTDWYGEASGHGLPVVRALVNPQRIDFPIHADRAFGEAPTGGDR